MAAGSVRAACRTAAVGMRAFEGCSIAVAVAVVPELEVRVECHPDVVESPSAGGLDGCHSQAPVVELLEVVLSQGRRSSHGSGCWE